MSEYASEMGGISSTPADPPHPDPATIRAAHNDGSVVIIWDSLQFYLGGVQRNPFVDAIDAAFDE